MTNSKTKQAILYKNLTHIRKQLLKLATPIILLFILASILFGRYDWALSAFTGSLFSFLALNNLMVSQSFILKKQSKKAFFIPMIIRLGLYACPIMFALQYKEYLNLLIILVFLGAFQFTLVIWELIHNLKHYQKRREKWTESEK